MKIDGLTPDKIILQEFGKRLARVRKQQGLSQAKLAESAGIGIATLKRIEGGQDSQMETWIKVMKALSMTAALDSLLPETFNSPMQEVLSSNKANNKAGSRKREANSVIPWGDELK